jgi:hypothetical protein
MPELRLPRVNEPPRHLSLFVIGGSLARAYQDTLDQPLPARLRRILSRMERQGSARQAD